MARPKVYDRRVSVSIRLPESLHKELSRQADHRDVSINKLACRALEKYLESLGEVRLP